MKKLLYCAAALATLLFAGSCQKENLEPEQTTDGKVTFTVELPTGIQTKADIGDGTNVDQLIYEVWLTENEAQKDLTTGATRLYKVDNVALTLESDGVRKATLELDLMNDQNFTVLFWAQVNGTGAYNTSELTAVTYAKDLDKYSSNDESLAAFYGAAYVKDCKHIDADGKPADPTVTLRRPFAQLNLGTLNTTTQYTVAVEKSDVKITNVPTVFNVSTKEVSVPQVISFQTANVPTNPTDITVQNKDYDYVAMNYVFAGDNAEVEYNIHTKVGGTVDAVVNNVVKNVPLKENHRTNIIGNLLTSKVDYQIVVDADFNTPDIDLESVTDGLVQVTPDLNSNSRMYEISSANGFAYAMMEIVNNMQDGDNYEFYLLNSIDLTGINYVAPTLKAGTVLLSTGAAPVTRAASEITISGLESPIFEKVAKDAAVTFSDIVVEEHEGDAALVGEVEDGAEVMIYNCEASDSADEEVDLIGTGADNVVDLESGVSTLEQLQAALRTSADPVRVNAALTIAAGQDIVLDLNGKTVVTAYEDEDAGKHYYAFDNYGTLTIKDTPGKGKIVARGIYNRGTLTLESGTIEACDGNGGYGVRNYSGSSFVMNGGTIATTYEDDYKVNNGGYDATPIRVDESAQATISGGIVNNVCDFTMALENYGTTTITGGTFTSIHTTIANYGTMTIDGGSFKCNGLEGITAHVLWADGGTATINGGTFDGKDNYNGFNVDASEGATVNINGGKFLSVHSGSLYGEGTIVVAGGEFFDEVPAERLAKGCVVYKNGDVYTVFNPEKNGISDATELSLFAQMVNSGNSFSGKTVKLNADIDLGNTEWTPIGKSDKTFQGTFDGQNHTISNLLITGNKSDVGLFGITTNGEIKNLTVNNAKVSGRLDVGVVAGTPYTSKYTNIKVTGHVEVNGMSYVGGVGGKNAYADWTDVTVDVDETSYVKANSVEDGIAYRTYVGGVCGFNGEGGHTFTNITSNIDVKGSTIDVGGLFGIAHYGNNFVNCSCSADVEIYNAEAAEDAEEMGGIAGVWHNQNGTEVTFENCKFTGTLKANITEGVNLSDNSIVGNAYSSTGTGKLTIK